MVDEDAIALRLPRRDPRQADFSKARLERKKAEEARGELELARGACRLAADASHRREATWLRRPKNW